MPHHILGPVDIGSSGTARLPRLARGVIWLRSGRGAIWFVLVLAGAYTFARAARLKAEYYDGYQYLLQASLLAGRDIGVAEDFRPPLLSILQVPVVMLCRLAGPANPWLLRGPHLLSAALSMGVIAAVVWMLRQNFGATLSLLGGVLFVAERGFIRYGAHVMTDLPVTGLCVLSLAMHLQAARTRSNSSFLIAGIAFGAAVVMKYTAIAFGAVLAATELGALLRVERLAPREWRVLLTFDPRRWLGVAIEVVSSAVVVTIVWTIAFRKFYAAAAWPRFVGAFDSLKRSVDRLPGETWQDNLSMLSTMLSPALLMLALVGLVVSLAKPRGADIAFWAWLGTMGTLLLLVVGHNEARYSLPVVPAILYFAVRGVEAWSQSLSAHPRWMVAGVIVLVAPVLSNGVAQAWADRDPFFYRDIQGQAARALAASRRPGSPAFVVGQWHTLTASTPGPVPQDEFWNVFHGAPFVVAYQLGEPVVGLQGNGSPFDLRSELLSRTADGDVVLRLDGVFFMTAQLTSGRPNDPLQLWRIHRRELVAAGPEVGPLAARDGGAGGALRLDDRGTWLVPDFSGGPWWVFTRSEGGAWTYITSATFASGEPVALPEGSASIRAVTLLQVDVSQFD